MMRCRNCGAVIPEDSRFCPSCGLLNNIHIDFTEGHHPTRVVHYSMPERLRERIAARRAAEAASALSKENGETGDAIVSSLNTSSAGNGEREAAAKAEILNEEASEKAAYVVKTELPESEKSDIKAAEAEEIEASSDGTSGLELEATDSAESLDSESKTSEGAEVMEVQAGESVEAEEIAEAIEETADEATVEEAADAVKTEPAESGDSDIEKAEAENEKELSCVEADDTSDVTKAQELEPYSAVEKETESHAEPALEAASVLSKENGGTGDAIVSSLTSPAGNDEREAAAKAEILDEEASEEAADAVKTETADSESSDIKASEEEEIEASSDGTSGLELEATDSAESSDVMAQLAAEIERRQREQEEEEIRILSEQILVRIRELSGINAAADENNKNSVSENAEPCSDMGSTADIQSEDSSETDETEQEADIEAQYIEAEEDLHKDIQEDSVQIHNISDYRSEDINTEEEQAPELFEFDEAVEEEDGYMGEDPEFEAMASLPPDPSKWGSAIRSGRKLLLPMGIAIAAALSTLYYVNTPAVVLERGIKQSRRLIEKQSYEAALPVLSGLLEKNPDNRELYLLIINAYINSGKHEDALSAVETAVEKLPEDTELSGLYRQLKPEVEFIPSLLEAKGGYTDPVEISLYNVDNYKIHYSLEGGGKNLSDAVYEEAIALSTNGDYVITAYADAVDGAPGPSYTASYRVRLDPEKYHLDDWEQSDRGVSYITETGERVKGWFIKDDRSYYFDNDGYMLTGLAEIEQNSYFFSEDGVMQTGWVDYNGERRFFDADGKMLHSLWVDETYYLGDDGVMLRDTTVDGIYVDAEGMRSFSAAEEYSRHPDTIVVAKSGSRIDRGEYFELSAELYHSKANGRPAGEKDREIRLKLRKDAWMKYLDGGLISIQARDAVRFLPELYMQEISQNEAGEITGYSILLGEKR